MNLIGQRFNRLKEQGKKGFIVYIGAGDPDLKATHDLALAFDDVAREGSGVCRMGRLEEGAREGKQVRYGGLSYGILVFVAEWIYSA